MAAKVPRAQQQTIVECPGLITNTNNNSISPGALSVAENICIRRPNLIEHRRSMTQVSSVFSVAPKALFTYGPAMLMLDASGHMQGMDHAGGALGTITDEITNGAITFNTLCDGGGFAELNGNLYLTDIGTGYGVGGLKRLSSFLVSRSASAFVGAPRALDLTLTTPNPGTGFLAGYYSVAYRLAWKCIDANMNVIRGAPSGRFVFANGAATATNINIKSIIPAQILSDGASTAKWFYEIYRTPDSLGTATSAPPDPGDTMNLVYEGVVTATDIANKFISVTDIYPSTLVKGQDLYTNSTQEGIVNSNMTPPVAQDVCAFKGSLFLANTLSKQRATVTMLGVPDLWQVTNMVWNLGGRTLTLTLATTPTVAVAPDLTRLGAPGDGRIHGAQFVSLRGFVNANNNNTFLFVSTSDGITNLVLSADAAQPNPVTEVPPAGTTAMAGRVEVMTSNSGTPDVYTMYHHSAAPSYPGGIYNAVQVPVTGTPTQQVYATAIALVNSINNTVASRVYAYYSSGPTDAPGIIALEERLIGDTTQYYVQAFGTAYSNKWSPSLLNIKNFSNDASPARLWYSKPSQPEHWPLINYIDVGSRNSKIVRLVANRESIFVFKDDGLFRVSGDGAGTWYVRRFDDTVKLTARSAVCVMHNVVYAITTRGVLAITEYGTQAVSMPVANIVAGTAGAQFGISNPSPERAVANEVDNTIYFDLSLVTSFGGVQVVGYYGLIYNATTGAWTANTHRSVGCNAMYFSAESSVYRAITADKLVMQEQRNGVNAGSYTQGDTGQPADRYTVALTNAVLNGNGTWTLTMSAANTAKTAHALGDVMVDSSSRFWVCIVPSGLTGVYQRAPWDTGIAGTFAAGPVSVYVSIPVRIEWHPYSAGDDADTNRFIEASVLLDAAAGIPTAAAAQIGATNIIPGAGGTMSFYTEIDSTQESVAFGTASIVNNFSTPIKAANPGNILRTLVPRKKSRARKLFLSYQHATALEYLVISGVSFKWLNYSDPNKQSG